MSEREAILEQARSQLGYRAGAGDDTPYGRWYGLNHNPWCMMFVSWCAARAGVSEAVIPKMAYCPYAVLWFRSRGRFVAAGSGLPAAGDVIFFTDDGSSACHVGLVERVAAGRIHTIEGNSSDSVCRRSYLPGDPYLLGWGRPAYDEEESMEIRDIEIYLTDSNSKVTVRGCVEQGVTYIRLRDAEKLFPVAVGWDGQGRRATLSLNYKE